MALNRLKNVEKKLLKNDALGKGYDEVIQQYLKKGYISKVTDDETIAGTWYLPHFPVVKLDRQTTKIRIVFDASAKSCGVSLNDLVFQGPKLQNDVFDILLRFRKYPVTIICDIAEMYLQIGIAPEDRSCLRFLWQSLDQSKEPEVFEFNRVVFGMNCSPFLAQYVTQEHARRSTDEHPLASETILKSTYMDDTIDSVQTVQEGIELYKDLRAVWNSAGMHARKWLSNSAELLKFIPPDDRSSKIDVSLQDLPSVKALGLMWNAELDEFRFWKGENTPFNTITKRTFLSEIAKIFDPLGFLAPFTIRGKMIMQKMWLSGVAWDERLSPEIESSCFEWLSELKVLELLRFQRCINVPSLPSDAKLHVFVDASEGAYGAVIYLSTTQNDEKSVSLVAAKSMVAPLKSVSIPRLELMAAVLGVKLVAAVLNALGASIQCTTFWSDSQNVLWWIRNQSRVFKPFVANRVGYIHQHSCPGQWLYIPSAMNSADMLTRGVSAHKLKEKCWLHAPEFLTHDENEWPPQPEVCSSKPKLELKQTSLWANAMQLADFKLDPSRFSDWSKLCRIMAWVYRFINNARKPHSLQKKGELEVEEMDDVVTHLIVDTQRKGFPDDYAALASKRKLASSSKIAALQPFLDEDGLMRSAGRLAYADLPYDARCPVILPRKYMVTRLLVKWFHEKCHHMGTNSTLAALSSKYWIPSAREEIRSWERECAVCVRRKAKPSSQIMAPLPAVRVKYSLRAFDQSAVDYAGPFVTVQGRSKKRQKRYLCLFKCMSTRAVHLEMAYGLDTNSFLNAFFRMASRRGMPSEMVSDNGTNFVAASKELKDVLGQIDQDKVQTSLAKSGVVWRFNPPHAPHFGGVFESLIKSAKRAMFAILTKSDVTDEELVTTFVGVESLLNSRPLTYQSAHPADEIPLTPNHFLIGQVGGVFAPSLDDESFNPKKRWRRVQELIRHFWKRWMREWLPSLGVRKKWVSSSKDIAVNDIVLVVSADTPRGSWPLGKVLQVFPGKDGHVRVVVLQVGKSRLTRPVTKICPLEWTVD
ncbi:uncharacterized protein [Haliotis asinina]|uniref:uncharacterized protein n=1 Tax=Haliotis asinina TaxID=109174 RepID=UPI00353193B4